MSAALVLSNQHSLVFTVGYLRLGRGENDREHWAAKAKRVKQERGRIIWAWTELGLRGQLRVPEGPPWNVHLVRLSPANVQMDDDNIVGSMKHVRDQIAAQLHVNDGDKRLVRFSYDQEIKAKDWGVRVEIRQRLDPSSAPSACPHASRFYRHTYGPAGEFHVVERCHRCGNRLREGWVPRTEVPEQLLEEDPWAHGNNPRQGRLI